MATGGENWRAVAEAVRARQAELGLSQQELVLRSGVSAATIRKLQSGTATGFRPATLGRISDALDWPANALLEVALGSEPPAAGVRRRGQRRTVRLAGLAARLSDRELRAVERLVEELVRGEPERDRPAS